MGHFSDQKIVVPVDFSDESFAAIKTAIQIGEQASSVHVVHVLPELSRDDPGVVWSEINDANRVSHATEALRDRLDEQCRGVHIETIIGDAGYRIAEYAKQLDADLIVMPSHGRTGIKRWLIGSVAERVLRIVHCPVLVLRK